MLFGTIESQFFEFGSFLKWFGCGEKFEIYLPFGPNFFKCCIVPNLFEFSKLLQESGSFYFDILL